MMATPQPKLIAQFVEYLRTTRAPPGLFADDVANTIHAPGGHYVVRTPAGMEEELRRTTRKEIEVDVKGYETTPTGFVVEFTQRTAEGDLYEEMAWATVRDGRIVELRWYCTGVVAG